ncbi:hypothetical protein ZHAS_00001722 [Anopheles sinensis]|uniref:Uncharacterized protein n=1 Tax=Anopheles sinensis TaxID=74873 RepID=A0A084VBJ5_ANOSI|nr:hypothetical protein ZHAS_00001722 [Anopheles sinensis]
MLLLKPYAGPVVIVIGGGKFTIQTTCPIEERTLGLLVSVRARSGSAYTDCL